MYAPIPAFSLSKKHRNIINSLLKDESPYLAHHPILGWGIRPNGSTELYRANSAGIRAEREYSIAPPKKTIRIATFGDSFIHCDDVKNANTWQEAMHNLNSRFEVLNFGVGGYGLDQALLRYENQGLQYNPHIVFIGFMAENIYRSVNTFRPFYYSNTNVPLTKPRFIIRNGQLTLIKNPLDSLRKYQTLLKHEQSLLSKIGTYDYYYQTKYHPNFLDIFKTYQVFREAVWRYSGITSRNTIIKNGVYNTQSEAYSVITKLFDKFYRLSLRNNSLPIIVIFPQKKDLQQFRKEKKTRYSPLLHYLNSKHYLYIDLLNAFDVFEKHQHIEDYFEGHYSQLGNEAVAKYMMQYLLSKNLMDRHSINMTLKYENKLRSRLE